MGEKIHYGGKFSSGQGSVPQGQKVQSYNKGPETKIFREATYVSLLAAVHVTHCRGVFLLLWLCWRLTQQEAAVLAQEANVVVNSPVAEGGRVAVIDLVAGGSEGNIHHSDPHTGLKQSAIEKVYTPANWPFDTMLTRTRAQAMKRMTDKSITDSSRKKACTVQTALANNVETYVSIVRDMIPGAPALQDVLEVCLTQASLEAKK